GPAMSAFQIAFNVPNLIRSMVADNAISAAFVPVFVELREQGREGEAWHAAAIVLWLAALGLGLISVVAVVCAPCFVPFSVPGNAVPASLTVTLARWMFPIIAILGLTGVVTGILNAYGVFAIPAIAPVVWNIVIIGALLVASAAGVTRWDGVQIYA